MNRDREDYEDCEDRGEGGSRDGRAGRDTGHDAGRDTGRDVDAEFAALMAGMDGSLASADGAGSAAGADGPEAPAEDPDGSSGSHVASQPAGEPTASSAGAVAGQELTPEQEAEVAALVAALDTGEGGSGDGQGQAPRAVKVAVVVTPVARADALAALCAMSDLDCTVVPSSSGALAVKQLVSAHAEWDIAELVGGAETEPAEAAELAASLSRLSRAGVVLMTADLATDVGIESGLSGTITARRYVGGQAGEDASAGLLLASMDQVVEDLLLGATAPQDVPGALRSTEVRPSRAMRWLGRGLRRPPRS